MGNYLCNSPGCGVVLGTDEQLPQEGFCDKHAKELLKTEWNDVYRATLLDCVDNDPEYIYWRQVTPDPIKRRAKAEAFADAAFEKYLRRDINIGGKAFKKACKSIGIKPTFKAMEETFGKGSKDKQGA